MILLLLVAILSPLVQARYLLVKIPMQGVDPPFLPPLPGDPTLPAEPPLEPPFPPVDPPYVYADVSHVGTSSNMQFRKRRRSGSRGQRTGTLQRKEQDDVETFLKEVMGSEFMTMIPKSEVGPFTRWLRDEARKASKEHPRKETFDPNWLVEHLKRTKGINFERHR